MIVMASRQRRQWRQQRPAGHSPEAAQHAAPGVEEAHLAAFDQQSHGEDHHRGDERFGDRQPERFDRVGEAEVGAGTTGGAVDAALAGEQGGEPAHPADDHECAQPDRHHRSPVPSVELPRRSHDLAEGAAPAQLGQVDRAPLGHADEEQQQQDRDRDHRDRRRSRPRLEVDHVGDRGDGAAEGAADRGAGESSRPAHAGSSSVAFPSRRTVRATASSSAGRSGRC